MIDLSFKMEMNREHINPVNKKLALIKKAFSYYMRVVYWTYEGQ